jgi:hypothetical protein
MAEKVNITFQPAKKSSEMTIFGGVSKLAELFSFNKIAALRHMMARHIPASTSLSQVLGKTENLKILKMCYNEKGCRPTRRPVNSLQIARL